MSERTALYRLYAVDGTLLYVGVTKSLGARWRQHTADKPWWSEVARQAIDWHPARSDALAAEESAIHEERPRYNVVHGERPPRGAAERIAALTAAGPGGRLRALSLTCSKAVTEREGTHRALVRAIWGAADQGMPQVEIVKDTGLTRERIRQLCDPKYRAKHHAAVLGEPGQAGVK